MTGVLVAAVLVLAVVAIGQLSNLLRLRGEIRGGEHPPAIPTERDNNRQGTLMLLFGIGLLIAVIWSLFAWRDTLLPEPAAAHGRKVDTLMRVTLALIFIVFFITQPLLFYFTFKYRGVKGRRALYYPHNDRLELVWTSIPATVLAGIIVYGLLVWKGIMYPSDKGNDDPLVIEVYGQQFNWTFRYAGRDSQLGDADVRFVGGENIVGIDPNDSRGRDDILTKTLHIPKGRKILFQFRSQDVIHSAYMPHFRVQMNCVPGMVTQFSFTPAYTTAEFRQLKHVQHKVSSVNDAIAKRRARGEDVEPWDFDYVLLCNKICGSGHYNMQAKIRVEEPAAFSAWLAQQKEFKDL